jgi:hypothetical protein
MPDPFISRQDLVDYLGVGGTADPGMLIAVDAACDICRDGAGVTFNRAVSTITLDGTGTDALLLPEVPVNSAGTVVIGGTVSGTAVTGGTTVTDYRLKSNGVLIRKVADPSVIDWDADISPTQIVWPAGRQNVTVTYDHGWDSDELPRSVRMVALSVAARIAVQGPAISERVGDNQITYAVPSTDLTDGERRILRKAAGR